MENKLKIDLSYLNSKCTDKILSDYYRYCRNNACSTNDVNLTIDNITFSEYTNCLYVPKSLKLYIVTNYLDKLDIKYVIKDNDNKYVIEFKNIKLINYDLQIGLIYKRL